MNFLRNFKIATKLAIAFVALVIITLAMSFVLWKSLGEIHRAEQQTTLARDIDHEFQLFRENFAERRQGLLYYLLTGDRDGLKHYRKYKDETESHYQKLSKLSQDAPRMLELTKILYTDYSTWTNEYSTKQVELMRNYLTVNQARAIEVSGLPQASIDHFLETSHDVEKEVDRLLDEAMELNHHANMMFKYEILVSIGIMSLAAIFFGVALTRAIAHPVGRITNRMTHLAEGNLDVEIRGTDRQDELGGMARAVQVFKDNAIVQKEMQAQEAVQQQAERERTSQIEQLTRDFDARMEEGLRVVTAAVENVSASAGTMERNAQQTEELSQSASAAIEETNANIQTVSSATTQLSSSVDEISRQMTQTAEVSRTAVEEVERTTERVKALSDAAESIGQVIQIISDIAEQTNLLALNATIESARAGDAGKGFAVVANEVKTLAGQTSKATEEIGSKITEIQNETSAAADAVMSIGNTIRKIDELTTAIVSAIEQQGAATSEIARSVEDAATGTNEVASVVQTVASAANETGRLASSQLGAVEELDASSNQLKDEIRTFLDNIKQL